MKLLPEGPMQSDLQSSHIPQLGVFACLRVMMASSRQGDNCNWLLVEWQSGGRDVIYVRSVVNPVPKELKIGDVLTANRRGEQEQATLIARARE